MRAVGETLLAVLLVLATSVWVGGLITIAVVARVATRTLGTVERVAFFRGFGRAYGIVGGSALLVALATGATLAARQPWTGLLTVCAVLAAVLVVTTAIGVRQAWRMTRLRQLAATGPAPARAGSAIRRGAGRAAVLRALIGVLSLALLVLGVLVAS